MIVAGQLAPWLASCSGIDTTATASGSGGVPIAYEIAGSGDTALIFVHGWSCDRSYWREQVTPFSGEYLVVTMDLGGHGESPPSRDDWTIESFGEDVAAVAAAVDAKQIVLIGHSMSGQVVLDAAGRLGKRVVGIIGVDTLKDASVEPLSVEQATEMFATFEEDFPAKMDSLVRRAFFTEGSSAELIDWVATDMAAGDPVVAVNAGVGLAIFDIGAALQEIEGVPLTVIDADYQATGEEKLKSAYPGARVITIRDSGHFVMLEQPAAFNEALHTEIRRFSAAGADQASGLD